MSYLLDTKEERTKEMTKWYNGTNLLISGSVLVVSKSPTLGYFPVDLLFEHPLLPRTVTVGDVASHSSALPSNGTSLTILLLKYLLLPLSLFLSFSLSRILAFSFKRVRLL